MAEYTEWSEGLEAALAEPFPREWHKQPQRGQKGIHVPVQRYAERLNQLVGVAGWSMEPPIHYHAGNKFGLAIGITVLGVTKWNVGDEMEDHGEPDEDNKVRDFGSSSTNSFAQAFKRCCAYGFGLGFYLYDKEWTKQYVQGRAAPRPNGRRQPKPEPRAIGQVKAEMLVYIRALETGAKLEPEHKAIVSKAESLAELQGAPIDRCERALEYLKELAGHYEVAPEPAGV